MSTGVFDQTGVNDVLGGSGTSLGNGETGYGYAIKGVEFSYVQVADVVQFSESENDSRTDSHVEVLYAIDKTKGADFLKALNLADGKNRYTNADALDSTKYYYQSDVLIDALAAALESNSTAVKNALEAYISANSGAAMPLTDAYGKTKAENLALGLYLVVETKVPEMVVSTTNPFLVSVPMTSVNGTNATDGGTRWIYDITLYPKNLTGIPSLEKTLRENKNDTGKNQVPLPASPTAMPTPHRFRWRYHRLPDHFHLAFHHLRKHLPVLLHLCGYSVQGSDLQQGGCGSGVLHRRGLHRFRCQVDGG